MKKLRYDKSENVNEAQAIRQPPANAFDLMDMTSGLQEVRCIPRFSLLMLIPMQKTLDELKNLLTSNLDLRVKAIEAVLEYHCSEIRDPKQDIFILKGYK